MERFRQVFEQSATSSESADSARKCMSQKDFVEALAPTHDFYRVSQADYGILFRAADARRSGCILEDEFVAFVALLGKPDAEYEIAFRVFSSSGASGLTLGQVKALLAESVDSLDSPHSIESAASSESAKPLKLQDRDSREGPDKVPFDFDSQWAHTYLEGSPSRTIGFEEFAQLLKDFQMERLRQLFKHFDSSNSGFVSGADFSRIMAQIGGHKLSSHLLASLHTLPLLYSSSGSDKVAAGLRDKVDDKPKGAGNDRLRAETKNTTTLENQVFFAEVQAFYNVVRQMDLISHLVHKTLKRSPDGLISKADFRETAASVLKFNSLTPMEADIVWHFAAGGERSKAEEQSIRLAGSDFAKLFDPNFTDRLSNVPAPSTSVASTIPSAAAPAATKQNSAHHKPKKTTTQIIAENLCNFALGSVAGAVGATVVYPIDLVKTRMQNQRSAIPGELMYKNSFDCFLKVIRNEGVGGLYSGLIPQLVGVAPEKAIKLTMNDYVRNRATDDDGNITLPWEIIAGCTAGGSQVVFTNPLEIVKIRLQVQGESKAARRSAISIVRSLGLLGLYKGAGACLLRDIPFSAIYFPAYAHLKKDVFGEGTDGKRLSAIELLSAGAIAGMPAAYFTTPADVIKTRLQVEARKGQTSYAGMMDATSKIYKEEGFKAFFKGGPARIFRSSPQFGVTLFTYEALKKIVPVPFADNDDHEATINAISNKEVDMHTVRMSRAVRLLNDGGYRFVGSDSNAYVPTTPLAK